MKLSRYEARQIVAAVEKYRLANGPTHVQLSRIPVPVPKPAGTPLGLRVMPLAVASTAYLSARRNGRDAGQAIGEAATHAAPAIALRAMIPAIAGYAPHVAKFAMRGNLALLAGMTAYNAGAGAIAGYQRAGLSGAVTGAGFGALDTVTFGAASLARAYYDDTARGKAQAKAPPVAPAAAPRLAAATRPASDGTTAAYTRVDPRTRMTVQVGQYRTPT